MSERGPAHDVRPAGEGRPAHEGPVARVAVIPARGGSKRIPGKNVRLLDGRPLVAWAIDTCRASGCFDRVIVSTDDSEVADIARTAGADVPFLRDVGLGDDFTPIPTVIADAVRRLSLAPSDLVCCVYPTSIGLLPDDLVTAAELLDVPSDLPYVVGVVPFDHPIQRALRLQADGTLTMVDPTLALVRTQDLEPRWHDAGQYVWGSAEAWLAETPVLTAARGVELPSWRAIDLDTEDDWARAELVHALLRAGTRGNRLG